MDRATLQTVGLGVLLAAACGVASASEIVRWVDADGVVHFGDRQSAPPTANEVEVRPTNGMDVPERLVEVPAKAGSVVKLDRSKLQNKQGFRGYNSRPQRQRVRVPNK